MNAATPPCLAQAVRLDAVRMLPAGAAPIVFDAGAPVLVVLAAGQGTRFGAAPKCVQPVCGKPLARHAIDAFRTFTTGPVVCVVGYRHEEVTAALGPDNLFVLSANSVGGTAFAAYEALAAPGLRSANPLLILTMGDRVITAGVFRRLLETHAAGPREADLTFLTARYQPPRHLGRGRVQRDAQGRVMAIVEQKDIDAIAMPAERRQILQDLTEGNCPLYAVRAAVLERCLAACSNDNAQRQYYLTDLVAAVVAAGGDVRTVTATLDDPDYDLLCSDVTRPADLALLEGVLAARGAASRPDVHAGEDDIAVAARRLAADRPPGQTASIARQIEELLASVADGQVAFAPDEPVALGVSGGRLRIAFMHPDMVRFYGPAWQMPIGAADAGGDEQIVLLAQAASDRQIRLHPADPKYREIVNAVPADSDAMFPGEEVAGWHAFEAFGTRLNVEVLLSLGYFSDEELARRREAGLPLPPPSLWVCNNLRRPLSLVGNAIASLRTLRAGALGARVQRVLGRDAFQGLRLAAIGGIPQGGFASSSALTLAVKNALDALYGLGIPADLLVHLAAQAEYGTGVRAGPLDQATEQKGRAGRGALISSNPRDNYRELAAYDVPAERIRIFFPYSVARDREAWRWSGGVYAQKPGPGPLTAGEMRKLTGKAAELAALLVRLPLATDFFPAIEEDLLRNGELALDRRRWIAGILRPLPLLASRDDLHARAAENRAWLIGQLIETERLGPDEAGRRADATLAGLFAGWRDPVLRRPGADGSVIEEHGVPLRAMLAYLFAEVARNFRLVRHPDAWIETVRLSQRGDRCFEIDPDALPPGHELAREQAWEVGSAGPARLDRWLQRCGARPFDYSRGLDDRSLDAAEPPDFVRLEGSSFFRGLALIDLAEAMLLRAFGPAATAVRVNAAGQGDYFQVHVDTRAASPDEVKRFLRSAFFRRFGLTPDPDIVEVHPGGGAAGVRLSHFRDLAGLARRLRSAG